jgi:transposase
MAAAVKLRTDFTTLALRVLSRETKNANQSRRPPSVAAVLDGMNRTEAARIGGMDRQTLRDWIHWFDKRGSDGLSDHWAKGPTSRLSGAQLDELAQIVETGPNRETDKVVRCRRMDLQKVIAARFGVDYHERHVGTLLKRFGFSHMNFSHMSARPRHPGQDAGIMEVFKNIFPRVLSVHLPELPAGTPIEIWFQMLCGRAPCKLKGSD